MIKAMTDNDHAEDEDFLRSKKKRKRSHNPLAQARGKQQSHENIWFRRTGAGFHLFVEYYANQPSGTVVQFDNKNTGNNTINSLVNSDGSDTVATTMLSSSTATRGGGAGGKGESRASKRRKMKQQRRQKQDTSDKSQSDIKTDINEEKNPVKSDASLHKLPFLDASTLQHPLWQAFSSQHQHHQQRMPTLALLRPFIAALSQPLPLTFRIRGSILLDQMNILQEELSTSDFSNLVTPLPFGDNRIYQAKTSALSKESLSRISPQLKEFLVNHSLDGSLARQELGSMLPVLTLEKIGAFAISGSSNPKKEKTKNTKNKKRICRVLDLCASPGSKTLQALELFHLTGDTETKGSKVQGRVVANDVNDARLETLQAAVQRSGMPQYLLDAKHLSYTCQDARNWTRNNGGSVSNSNSATKKAKPWQIILCDVPCSGDGTVRKDAQVLPMWKPDIGNALHATQLAILKRALQLVDVGGVVCYSTCSLNPVEDEAVVAAALSHFNNTQKQSSSSHDKSDADENGQDRSTTKLQPTIELIDFPELPGFVRRPGISTWKVADFKNKGKVTGKDETTKNSENNGEGGDGNDDDNNDTELPHLHWYANYGDACEAKMDHALPSLWPPLTNSSNETGTKKKVVKEHDITNVSMDWYHLERCTRLWPQDHDSGGFFLALLRRNR